MTIAIVVLGLALLIGIVGIGRTIYESWERGEIDWMGIILLLTIVGIVAAIITSGDEETIRVVNGVTEQRKCRQVGTMTMVIGKTTSIVPQYKCEWVATDPQP